MEKSSSDEELPVLDLSGLGFDEEPKESVENNIDNQEKVNTQEKADNQEKKLSARKRYKKAKKECDVLYRAIHWNPRPFVLLWIFVIILAFLWVFIRTAVKFFRNVFFVICVIGLVGGGIFLWKIYPLYQEYDAEAARISKEFSLDDFKINESSKIYDCNGKLLATVKEDADQAYLDYEDIPKWVIDAFVAVEDRTFWINDGVDYSGIVRVGLNYVKSGGEEAHGASTITQQLVKNVYLSSEVTLKRKFTEILVARALTKQFTKRDIITFYCNDVYFANGVYGIAGASKRYFDCEPSELTLSQCAYLCAIPNRPSYYDPIANPDNAIERRDKILGDMLECGYITRNEYTQAINEEIDLKEPTKVFHNYETTYTVDCAIKYLMKKDGFKFKYKFKSNKEYNKYHEKYNDTYEEYRHKLYTGGYKIYTSLDKNLCKKMQSIVDNYLKSDTEKKHKVYNFQGALTCIDNRTGKVVALVGGRTQKNKYDSYSFNRAYQSYRQSGSTIKPIVVYTPVLESGRGYTSETIVDDIDVSKAKEKGVDIQSLTGTKMTIRSAVEWSKNGVAWKLYDELTPTKGMSYLTNMKFSNLCPDDYNDAIALGGFTYGVTTVEMAGAYASLANHGDWKEPTCIVSMRDNKGIEIYKEPKSKEIYTDKAADDMVDILRGVLTKGTAQKVDWSGVSQMDAFCKTGTTNDDKDGWLCGSTPYYSIAVWVGYDTPKTVTNISDYTCGIWRDCMLTAIKGKENTMFTRNDGDISYNPEQATSGYYSYLQGRDDSEVLSDGYTVGDYRKDRVIGENVTSIINQIKALPRGSSQLESLYQNGLSLVDTIYSTNYTNEMKQKLDNAYYSRK